MNSRTEEDKRYKTLTAKIQTETLLDDFVPSALGDIAERFVPIRALEQRYCALLRQGRAQMQKYSGFGDVAEKLTQAHDNIEVVFNDFEARMNYFTIMFFGAVSAGKTSMICDLAQTQPDELSSMFIGQPGYVATTDAVSIGPNVATMHLYEILIEKSGIRLVDVPGIGGVVHENESLAPFVAMADCVVFLIGAGNDITKDDSDFLYGHVAAIDRILKEESQDKNLGNLFRTEEAWHKQVLVVLNKWGSAYQNVPEAFAGKDFERKSEWILHGDGKTFHGIAGYFAKKPMIVRSNTRPRDTDTGKPYPGTESQADLSEVVGALKEILQVNGADYRINRPLQALNAEIEKMIERLNSERAAHNLESLFAEAKQIQISSDLEIQRMINEVETRLRQLEVTVSTTMNSGIKPVIRQWKPRVSLWRGLQGAVPDWVGKHIGLGKTEMQKALKTEWEETLRERIESSINPAKFQADLGDHIKSINRHIAISIRAIFANNPTFAKCLSRPDNKGSHGPMEISGGLMENLSQQLDETIGKVQMGVMDDIMGVIRWDSILIMLAGVILTPAGAFLLALWRRARRGETKGQEAREEIEAAVDEVARKTAEEIRSRVSEKIFSGIDKTTKEIRRLIEQETDAIEEPLLAIDALVEKLKQIQVECF